MPDHFSFTEGATIEDVRGAAKDLSRCAGSYKPEERAKIFHYASMIKNGLAPDKSIYQSSRFQAYRFGDGKMVEPTELDKELIAYRTTALEIMAQQYLLGAYGGAQNPVDPRIIQHHRKCESSKQEILVEVHSKTPIDPETVKDAPDMRVGIKFNDSMRGQQTFAMMTGSAFRENLYQKGKENALEGISFNPTDSLIGAYRFCARHENPASFLNGKAERYSNREVVRALFHSGVLGQAWDLLEESLLMGPPYQNEDIIDFYHYLTIGVEGGVICEGIIDKLPNTDTFIMVAGATIDKVLPKVREAVKRLNDSGNIELDNMAKFGTYMLKSYDEAKSSSKTTANPKTAAAEEHQDSCPDTI